MTEEAMTQPYDLKDRNDCAEMLVRATLEFMVSRKKGEKAVFG
jgi:hypothetical protein